MIKANLSGVDLSNQDLTGTILIGANLTGAKLDGVDLRYKDLTGTILSGVDLSNKDLTGVHLSGVDLSNHDLTGTILIDVNLSGVNLSGVDLSNTDLTGTILTDADLSGAKLDGVDLRYKDLTGVNLSGVDLSNKDLTGTILKDAKKIKISLKNPSNSNWPALNEVQNLNVTRYDLSADVQYLATKEGFLFESKNNESRLVLDLNKDAQFPFSDGSSEAGLLGVASKNDLVYVSYTSQDNNELYSLVVDEYSMNFSKVRNIIKIAAKGGGHYGGTLVFDKLGRLYLSVGDGGSMDDAQNLKSLMGKILRLDVSKLKQEPEIVAYGLRNPWKVSIDSKNRMFIGACGSSSVESVYLLNDLYSVKPYNLGWPVFEGTNRNKDDPLMFKDTLAPIYEYFTRPGCAIGGFYLDHLEVYLFGDLYGTLRLLKEQKNGGWYLYHSEQAVNVIWSFGYDEKTKKIFIGPNNFELKISIELTKLDSQVKLCRTTMPNGSINNSGCH